MPAGKLAAQAGHAFLGAFENAPPSLQSPYHSDGPGTKIVLAAPSLDALLQAADRARELGLPHYLVQDRGHVLPPHFDGTPIYTALGFGPALRPEVQALTRRFALVT